MKTKPVSAEAYDEKWLTAAWGEQSNDFFLKQEVLHPRPRVARALELADIRRGMTVLDIACGRGEIPVLAAQAGACAVGVDFSKASLAFAVRLREHSRESISTGTVEFIRADACRLPFADSSFERITMLDIVEHLVPDQLEAMFREVHRLLKPGGFTVIHTLPNRWVYDVTFPLLHRFSKKFPHDPRGPIDREIHVNEQDLPTLHGMLSRCGLSHRLWLEQQMPAQARWNQFNDRYGDNRDRVYPTLVGPVGKVLEWLSMTPLKLLLANDIYGVAWKHERPVEMKLPLGIIERLAMLLPERCE
ncbi:class I SAM-dependent methyltransferase [Methylocaldum sp. BRCS4]|jgi:SAM-dependent methyltransferase|nr:class I SAM-dependent methyltransferase [Methylocaldum sp. BRCS4]